jgi:plastocyanin
MLTPVSSGKSVLVLTAALAVLAAAAAAVFAVTPGGAAAAGQTVEVGNLYFCSPEFEDGVCDTNVTAGDTVTWNNVEGFHTATECGEDFIPCPLSGGFDSDLMEAGDSYSYTFSDPGIYWYYCALHPSEMRGRVLFAAAPTDTPTLAPTAAPTDGATSAPTAAPVTPAGVPATGGPPDGASNLMLLPALGAGLLVAGGAGLALGRRR